jgi:cytochrome c oxidase subunit IV
MEFHDNYPSYETMYNHDEEYGKKSRKKLWMVFWIMLVVTIVELIIGTYAGDWGLLTEHRSSTLILKVIFVGLTLAKAGYIVVIFMHLGHEVKFFKYVILLPYVTFMLYGIFIILTEGSYAGESGRFAKVDPILVEQQKYWVEHHKHGGPNGDTKAHRSEHEEGTEAHGEQEHH